MDAFATPVAAKHRFTVDDYYRMAELGTLTQDANVELIDGTVFDEAPRLPHACSVTSRLLMILHSAVGRCAIVGCHAPLRLSMYDEPAPELMLLRPKANYYRDAHPGAKDVLLVIEVAETSARYDREIKVPLYAKHGVPEVWIVDLEAGLVRFYRQPVGERYTDITATETPGPTPVAALPGIAIDLTDVL